jgi:NAD(P) transhydrogenase subunit beta
MTAMPELVALLHSFVGLAAVLVGIASELKAHRRGEATGVVHGIEVYAGVFIGAVTFTGSVVAFLKLRGAVSGRPLLLPFRHVVTAAAMGGSVALAVAGVRAGSAHDFGLAEGALLAVTAIAALLGIHLIMAIGGGDMPVVVSLLNSYSGWAAAATGFMLQNELLIITGALVGSSGAILSYIMCRAMNRSIWSVVFGGFGAEPARPGAGAGAKVAQQVRSASAEEVAALLAQAQRVIIVPGYGMAVAQAQHSVVELALRLEEQGTAVHFAIHPVAGRLPGHMNVLLAEAGAAYESVKEVDEVRDSLPDTDVVVVIGANDVVNPSALDDRESPLYGMPVIEVWRAAKVVMLKRGMAAGYAGVDNPLCYRENTLMLFGDARQTVRALIDVLQQQAA